MSFLDKLKVKVEEGVIASPSDNQIKDAKPDKNANFLQLEVDIFQTFDEIYIIAPIAGVDMRDLDISIENENDVVTIQGRREMPALTFTDDTGVVERKFLRQECQWGHFYRQVILPQEINVAKVEAKFKKGVLILKLPLLRLQTKGKKKILVN